MSQQIFPTERVNSGPVFAVLGAGSWGTALSMQLMRSGSPVILWDWDREHIEAIGEARCNEQFLPDYPLPDGLVVEPDLEVGGSQCRRNSDRCAVACFCRNS